MKRFARSGRWFVAVLAIVAVLGATACNDDDGSDGGGGTRITVAVANPSGVVFAALYSAIDQGFFEDEGLNVNVEAVDGSGATIQALVSGQAQIGGPGPGPVLAARAAGEDIVSFYNLIARNVLGFWVLEDSDLESPEDLVGGTIGVGTADGIEVGFANGVFAGEGVDADDVSFLTVGDGGLATAGFERGDIDAYVGGGVDIAIMRARGLELRNITPDGYSWAFGNGFSALGSYIEENPDVIEGFGRALTRGIVWSRDTKEEALDIAAEVNPEEGEDRELGSALFDTMNALFDPLEGDDFGYFPASGWENWHDTMVEAGDLDEPLDDLEAAYTNEFVVRFNE